MTNSFPRKLKQTWTDMGDEKIFTFASEGAYTHTSSLIKYFSKISHTKNKSGILLKLAKIPTVAHLRSENSIFFMKLQNCRGGQIRALS